MILAKVRYKRKEKTTHFEEQNQFVKVNLISAFLSTDYRLLFKPITKKLSNGVKPKTKNIIFEF